MSFTSNHNTNSHLKRFCPWKRIFFTLIFFNTFLGCIYYFNGQNNQESIPPSTWKSVVHHEEYLSSSTKQANALQFIESILSSEYNSDDLNRFYTHVKKQYSLGLQCTRQGNLSHAVLRTGTRATTTENRSEN